jgi:enoyl-CoA hydratase
MTPLLTVRTEGSITTIVMDDGKVNALSPGMLAELGAALDRAEADGQVIVLTGREGVFSAGFDLKVLRAGGADAVGMLRGGFELCERLLSFPTPVVIACTGHAMAAGLFVLLSADYRIAAAGPFKIVANEVAIGLTMPWTAVEVCRQRLTPAHFSRVVDLAEVYAPDESAVAAGLVDQVVDPADLELVARATAEAFTALDLEAHAASKLRTRKAALEALGAALAADGFRERTS